MGGTISAASRTDRSGAVFTIRLPVPTELPVVLDPNVSEPNADEQNAGDLA